MFLLQEEYDSISVIYMRFDCNIMLYHNTYTEHIIIAQATVCIKIC